MRRAVPIATLPSRTEWLSPRSMTNILVARLSILPLEVAGSTIQNGIAVSNRLIESQ